MPGPFATMTAGFARHPFFLARLVMPTRLSLLLASAVLVCITGCMDSSSAPAGPAKVVTASTQDSVAIQLPPAATSPPGGEAQAAARKSEDEPPATDATTLSREQLRDKIAQTQQRGAALMNENKSAEAY